MKLLLFLFTTYAAAQVATALLFEGRLALTAEAAGVAAAVPLAQWGVLKLWGRVSAPRRG